MWLLKIFPIFLFLFPLTVFGQTIEENLQYINAQFEQFNKYNTSFHIDEVEKKIICIDKFGTYSANFEDVEIRLDSLKKSVGIFCIDGSKRCIFSTHNNGNEGLSFFSYTMELAQNGELIDDASAIIEKFSAIKKEILEHELITSTARISHLKYEVELQLQTLNTIFKEHSQYKNNWKFDWDNYWLIEEIDSCKVSIPLEVIIIEDYEKKNVQSFRHGFVFKSDDSVILKKCTNAENNINKTDYYLDNLTNAKTAIDCIKTIQKLVTGDEEPLSVPAKNTDQQLEYINEEFRKYNQFNTRFFVDMETRDLVWVQEFGESRAPFDKIDFDADYKQGWLVIYCKDGHSKCITSMSPKGKKIQNLEYTMSLKKEDKVIPHIDDVIDKFKALMQGLSN